MLKIQFSHFRKFDISDFEMTFRKNLIKKDKHFVMIDFQSSYKVLLFDKTLFCYFNISISNTYQLLHFSDFFYIR